jgi:hypothetical protein
MNLWWSVGVVGGYFYQQHAVNHPLRCPEEDERWPRLLEAVKRSQRLLESREGYMKAKKELADEISGVLPRPWEEANLQEAFECSIGLSSAFRILGLAYAKEAAARNSRRAWQIGLRMMHVSMNWLTHAFVVKGENDGRWIDESSWPLSIQEMNDEQTYIQNEITKTGVYGNIPTWIDCPYDFRDESVKIAIVTMCDYPAGHVLPRYSLSSTHLYAQKHGYTVLEEHARLDTTRPHAWGKIKLLQKYMSGNFDWLMWLDCDSFFMNHDVTLDHVLYSFGSELVGQQRRLKSDFFMLIQEDHAMLNTGVFFMKVNDWSRNLLERIYGTSESPWINHPWWENAAFSHEFLGSNHRRFRDVDVGAVTDDDTVDTMTGIYGDHVLVAPQVVFNSYHPVTSRIFQHDTWEPGKFILAFSGCTSGSSPNVAQHIYGEYYREMCALNGLSEKCVDVVELPFHPWVSA